MTAPTDGESQRKAWPGGPALSGSAIAAWAREHGHEERLGDSVERLRHLIDAAAAPWLYGIIDGRTIGQHLERVAANEPARLRLYAAYFAFLERRRRTVAARRTIWARPCATLALTQFSERVRTRLAKLAHPEPPDPAFAEHAQTRIDTDTFSLRMLAPSSYGRREVAVSLIAADADGARVEANLVREHPLIRIALETALDAAHDPKHMLHASLVAALEAPRWQLLLSRLERAARPEDTTERDTRLVWRIACDDFEGIVVNAAVQRRNARGQWSKGERVQHLSQLRSRRVTLDEHDERALAAAAPTAFARESPYSDVRGRLLSALAGHPRVYVGAEPGRVLLLAPEIVVDEREGELHLALRIGRRLVSPGDALRNSIAEAHCAIFDAKAAEVFVAAIDPALHSLLDATAFFATSVPIRAADALAAHLVRLPASVGLDLPPSMAGAQRAARTRPIVRLEPLAHDAMRAEIFVRPLGVGPLHRPGEGPPRIVGVDEGGRVHTERDLAAERHEAEALVAASGLERAQCESRYSYRIDELEDVLSLVETLAAQPALADVEWLEAPLRVSSPESSSFVLALRSAGHWFEADVEIRVDEEALHLAELLSALRDRRRYISLGARRFVRLTNELRAKLEAIDSVVQLRDERALIGPSAAAYLDSTIDVDADDGWRTLTERLRASGETVPVIPETLAATLRDYQADGVRWLLRLSFWATGACLADDMGLGKTVQTLAVLIARAELGPALVVCPTSVGDNWQDECTRFAPGLRPILYRGANRSRALDKLAPGDVLIASYDVVSRDRTLLSELRLGTLVLDEAQAIKNPSAQRTEAVRGLRASFSIALTGTPIENRLSELFSLFSILTPGLLGDWDAFRERFAVPIERHADAARLAQLRQILRPFVLRRTKAQVARELPARTEVLRPVELSEKERALYEAERQRALVSLRAHQGDSDYRFVLLGMLTRLRRLVCDPSLVIDDTPLPSSKLEDLFVLIDDLRREDHRALVFSQFTSLLARVRTRLAERGIEHLYLDGSTPAPQRAELVRRWQEGSAPIFLISLRAGGTGLNLTAADYVVHLDPWWNPAVEDQASDRAHRIGQTKPVTIVRLLAQDTLEERVLALHEKKRALAAGVLEGAESNATLDASELLALIEDAEPVARARRRSA